MEYLRLNECAAFSDKRTKNILLESYISTENMIPNKGGICTAESIPDSISASKYEPQDILLSNIRPYFRKIWYADREGSCSNDVLVLKAQKGIDSKFLYYVLSDNNFFNYDTVTSKGTKMPRGSKKAIMKYLVPNYDLPTQRRIASILSSYDNLIENNNKRIRLLEQMAENLYKEWFVRFRFPGHENAEFENGLPKGWRVATLSTEFNTSSGGTPSRTNMDYYSGSIPWIKTGELQGTFILDTEEHITEEAVRKSSAKLIPEYSLLIAMYAGANVGNIGINSIPATCNQACCVITTKGRYPLYYLKFFLQTQKGFLQSISFGAAQQNISQDIIKKLKVIFPPSAMCDTFNNFIVPYLHQCEVLMRENILLTNKRDLLLPRLMSGKLEVNIK